jgi:uncharacterized glyoxalase superfamily metalloenzyme YdcJ
MGVTEVEKLMDERSQIIKDLNEIYKKAMASEDYSNAIQAKKAIASIIKEMKTQNLNELAFQHFSDEQLSALIKSLQP